MSIKGCLYRLGIGKKVAEKVEDPVENWFVAPCLPGK